MSMWLIWQEVQVVLCAYQLISRLNKDICHFWSKIFSRNRIWNIFSLRMTTSLCRSFSRESPNCCETSACAAFDVGSLHLSEDFFCKAGSWSFFPSFHIGKVPTTERSPIKQEHNKAYIHSQSFWVDNNRNPHQNVVGDVVNIFAAIFSFNIHKHASDTQGFLYKLSKKGVVLLYAWIHVNAPVSTFTSGGLMAIRGRPSNFSHQQPVWIRKLKNIARNSTTENNKGNRLSVFRFPSDVGAFPQGIDTNVDFDVCPIYVQRFWRSRFELRANCTLMFCTPQTVAAVESICTSMP